MKMPARKKESNKFIVFLDDCQVFNKILIDGYFKTHPISNENELISVSSAKQLFNLINNDKRVIDILVLDYHLQSLSDGLAIAELIKHRLPDCVIWLYTGMTERHISDDRKKLIDRYIHKDKSIPFLLDELYKIL